MHLPSCSYASGWLLDPVCRVTRGIALRGGVVLLMEKRLQQYIVGGQLYFIVEAGKKIPPERDEQ